jgi:signal transduction histidine kinase
MSDDFSAVAAIWSATAEKSSLIDQLRRTNAALTEANAELEQQYAEVVEARSVKDDFLANISHELRTPLTSVLGYVSILQEELSGPLTDGQRTDLHHAKRAGERLLVLIEDLLELTTLRRGEVEVHVDEFDPLEVVREAVEATPGRGADVEVEIEAAQDFLPRVRSDRRKILKILASLLSNAYKFTARGRVGVSVKIQAGRIVFAVEDTGIGIPAEAQAVVFEEFRQVDGSVTRRFGGSGLGLALARRLARILGGDIELISSQGEGSRFSVWLPLEYAPVEDDLLAT